MARRLTTTARAGVRAAEWEARRHGDRRIGTDHVLLGLLEAPGSLAAAALGHDLASARAAVDSLDEAALRSVGIVAPEALTLPAVRPTKGHLSLTAGARTIFVRAVTAAAAERARSIEERHLLLALIDCAPPDPAGVLLDRLGVERSVVRSRLGPAA